MRTWVSSRRIGLFGIGSLLLLMIVSAPACQEVSEYKIVWPTPMSSITKGTSVYYKALERDVEIGEVTRVKHSDDSTSVTIAIRPNMSGKIRMDSEFSVQEEMPESVYISVWSRNTDEEPAPKNWTFEGRLDPSDGEPMPLWLKVVIGLVALLIALLAIRIARKMWPLLLAAAAAFASAAYLRGYIAGPIARFAPESFDPDLFAWIVAFVGGAIVMLVLIGILKSRSR